MTDDSTTITLTIDQRAEVAEMLKGYFGSEEADKRAQAAATKAVNWQFEDGMKAKLAGLMELEPAKLIDQLFRNSGMVVQTQASKEFDTIIQAVVKDEDSGIPAAIRLHVKENLDQLIQRAITQIIAAMVVDWLKSGVGGHVGLTQEIIRMAFTNASMNTRF